MPKVKQFFVFAIALGMIAVVLYLAYDTRPRPLASTPTLAGLSWLPAEAGLVAGVDLAELRQQVWLLELLRRASGEVAAAADYKAFVEATGFDYTRDLDRVWLAIFDDGQQSVLAGVAEGRFARDRILAYASQQGAALQTHQGVEIFQVKTQPAGPGRPERHLAFAFLDESHLAMASDSARAVMVVDCWLLKAPSVGSDKRRRAELEQLAAGKQAWLVDDLGRWEPPGLAQPETESNLKALIAQMALGLEVSEQGVVLAGEARCREPGQAERLHDNLTVLLLAGRMALARQENPSAQALGQALDNLTFTQQGDTLQARVLLPPEALAALLGVREPAPAAGTLSPSANQ